MRPEKIHALRYDIAHDYLVNIRAYKKDADLFIRRLTAAGYPLVIVATTKRGNMHHLAFRSFSACLHGKQN